ncbi:MAG: aldo/keto reductase [Oliverpabstia sp.]
MQYRKTGKKGENISILGLGCMRFPKIESNGKEYTDPEAAEKLVKHAYEKGINYFDAAPTYCEGKCEEILGNAVKHFRKRILLSSKIPLQEMKKSDDYRFWLENSLKKMQTDYLDYYLFWGINRKLFDEVLVPLNLLEEGQKAKEEGLIRNLSVSVHDSPENICYMLKQAEKYGAGFDSVLCQYNLLDRKNVAVLEYAKQHEIGTMVMGPVAGGRLAWPSSLGEKLGVMRQEDESEKLFSENETQLPTSEIALRYVMENQNVDCTLSGMSSLDMINENAALADKIGRGVLGFESRIQEAFEKLEKLSRLYCTGCNYCQPCPEGIQISKILYLVNCDRIYGLHTYARQEFAKYCKKNGIPSEKCIKCGKCEKRCPQSLQIRGELEAACHRLDGNWEG